jgi:hypothetical protein
MHAQRDASLYNGFLARLIYEQEIRKVQDTWPVVNGAVVPTADARVSASREKAMYAMRYFMFQPSTPDAKVSKILQDAFFDCFDYSYNVHFPILTNYGIRSNKDVREIHADFSSFMKMVPTQLLTDMGFLRHPPLEKLIEIAGNPDLSRSCSRAIGSEGLWPQLVRCAPFPSIALYFTKA